ncbi:MAG: hypothetical protein IT291_04905 [Deltaproteobacteria bacterium]|nr:hypothetical protein [Deltaproteobacteria bacterium]
MSDCQEDFKGDSTCSLWDAAISSASDEAMRGELASVRDGNDEMSLPEKLTKEDESKVEGEVVLSMIRDFPIPKKIKLALFGNKSVRAVLIRDTNKMIPLFVLENARISEEEVLEFAKSTTVADAVLREISGKSQWTKNYAVKQAITSNPKTPVDVALRWIKYLEAKHLKQLSKSKSISSVVATQCRKLLEKRQH